MSYPRALILYKKSAYSIYFEHPKSSFHQRGRVNKAEIDRFLKMHETHAQCLQSVEQQLKQAKFLTRKISRGKRFNAADFDLIVTVGGDGTFLEAARGLKNELILGVNSDPTWSVGRFCSANVGNFSRIIARLVARRVKVQSFPRLRLQLDGNEVVFLNDILVCHRNPAAMSRYVLRIGDANEEQKSSGVWISTAAGSSGAIKSAGGRRYSPTAEIIQYRPRELYRNRNVGYRLEGSVVPQGSPIEITSMMREGRVFVDGSHLSFAFDFGMVARITRSDFPLRVVVGR